MEDPWYGVDGLRRYDSIDLHGLANRIAIGGAVTFCTNFSDSYMNAKMGEKRLTAKAIVHRPNLHISRKTQQHGG